MSRPDGFWSRSLDLPTASILASRYVELKLAKLGGLLILVGQAPLLGWLVALAFDGQNESERLQFVLAMVAVWLGTFNACREIVKERPIYLRERRVGVSVRAYVVSKLGVLASLAAVQCLLFLIPVARQIRFDAALPAVFLALLWTAWASTGLGLWLSSMVTTQDSLIALVPIALIPQLVLSDLLLNNPPPLVERLQLLMLADWSLEILRELRKSSADWGDLLTAVLALGGLAAGFLFLTGVFLHLQDDNG